MSLTTSGAGMAGILRRTAGRPVDVACDDARNARAGPFVARRPRPRERPVPHPHCERRRPRRDHGPLDGRGGLEPRPPRRRDVPCRRSGGVPRRRARRRADRDGQRRPVQRRLRVPRLLHRAARRSAAAATGWRSTRPRGGGSTGASRVATGCSRTSRCTRGSAGSWPTGTRGTKGSQRAIRAANGPTTPTVDARTVPVEAIEAVDRPCFPAPRRAFLEAWIGQADAFARALPADDGTLRGYGVIRRCVRGLEGRAAVRRRRSCRRGDPRRAARPHPVTGPLDPRHPGAERGRPGARRATRHDPGVRDCADVHRPRASHRPRSGLRRHVVRARLTVALMTRDPFAIRRIALFPPVAAD